MNIPRFLKFTNKIISRKIHANTHLSKLLNAAENNPTNIFKQALNNSGHPHEVVKKYKEGLSRGDFSEFNKDIKDEYIKALAKISDYQQKQYNVNYAASYDPPPPPQQQQQIPFNNINYDTSENIVGTENNPLYTIKVKSKFDRFFRVLSVLPVILVLSLFIIVTYAARDAKVTPGNIGTSLKDGYTQEPQPVPNNTKRFNDVKGIDECLDEITELVDFLKNPQKYNKLGGKLPKGVLLIGAPGTGKTLIAKAIAGEAGVPLFYSSGSEFDEMFVGVGAARVKKLFATARKHAPCLIFIDEIDSLAGKRTSWDSHHSKQSVNQLLAEMDGFRENESIIVIGATNLVKSLDPAVLRPGRFDKHIEVPVPNVQGREDILKLYISKTRVEKGIDVNQFAKKTSGFTGADLENLVNTAAIESAKRNKKNIGMNELDYAYDRIVVGLENKSLKKLMKAEDKYKTAIHECGHALVNYFKKGNSAELSKITIIPRGKTLGVTYNLVDDVYNSTKADLLKKIEISLGGTIAEEIFFGKENVTTGASNDLQAATNIAKAIVREFGMSSLGPVDYGQDYDNRNPSELSPETKREIDLEVRKILNDCSVNVRNLILEKRNEIKTVANFLVEYETLSGAEVQEILKGNKIRTGLSKDHINF